MPELFDEKIHPTPSRFMISSLKDYSRLFERLENEPGYFGLTLPTPPIEKPKAEPVEKPDPYPSRAGWRADYLPPHDPMAEEPKDKPQGKIGEYEIIESATTFDDIGGNALKITTDDIIASAINYRLKG